VNAAEWTALGVVATAIAGYFGARYTARSGKRASQYSAMLNAPESISAGYDRLNDDLWRSVTALQADLAAVRAELKEQGVQHQRQYRASIAYIRELLSLLTIHAPHVRLPEPPPELSEDVKVTDRDRKDQP
jgi:hypothetical protein